MGVITISLEDLTEDKRNEILNKTNIDDAYTIIAEIKYNEEGEWIE